MDTLSYVALVHSNIVSASMHWSMLWVFVGFVSSIVFWYPIVKQFTDGR